MIPRLSEVRNTAELYRAYVAELRALGFEGDLSLAYADRTVLATDNSIYERRPEAIAFPLNIDDLVRVTRAASQPQFSTVHIAPRGGGTGTNGQSLSDGIVIDVSKYMNAILEINVADRWVRVQAGVVKDQLGIELAKHGLFFPPELSTSNRATIGGMISTDASGQGSCLYGKTRDHVIELTTVLLDGSVWCSHAITDEDLDSIQRRTDLVGTIHRLVDEIQREQSSTIEKVFPKLNRCLTGYDLAHIRQANGQFNINSILCGSEGTLGLIAEAKLNVLPIPRCSVLVNVQYPTFDAALRDAPSLMAYGAAAIETVDSKVLALAQNDSIWQDVRAFFPNDEESPPTGVNIVEFVGDTAEQVDAPVRLLTQTLTHQGRSNGKGITVARRKEHVDAIWEMRKRAVGLLGNMQSEARPVPFVEDTAVPPESLADYIAEFRALLDQRGLVYGMFGHVDAGVLHVRPALNLKDPSQERLVREITEQVVVLTRKYKGLLWGEHGKGVRSEFSPEFFGPLYPTLQAIKAAFDPLNQLNPGKIATPDSGELLRIDAVPLRGQLDRAIPKRVQAGFDEAMHCNGNGACYNHDFDDPMCPSWKGWRDRRHSPKGRAMLLREWLRQLAACGFDPVEESHRIRKQAAWRELPSRLRNSWRREFDFSHEVKEALDGCLACKSCTGHCPIKVDVPSFRSKFFELYYGRYVRPPRDHLVGAIEHLIPTMAKIPRVSNAFADLAPARAITKALGLVETPRLSGIDIEHETRRRNIRKATPDALSKLDAAERARSVVVVQDAFTSYYETPLLLDLLDLIEAVGFQPWLAPYFPNGKALHVHGFLGRFERLARANAAMLQGLADAGVGLVGLDPSMTLTYRSEYLGPVRADEVPRISLPQEWLVEHLDSVPQVSGKPEYLLLPHCTERAMAPGAVRAWETTFEHCGLKLNILPSGCCGMAGTWGHEAEHREMSKHIYSLSWGRHVKFNAAGGRLLADGYSCRSQVKLVDGVALLHPIQALLDSVRHSSNVSQH